MGHGWLMNRGRAAGVITPMPGYQSRARRAWSRPPSAGDIAQARIFDDILQGEVAELRELAAALDARGADEPRHNKERRRVNARINEVLRMLDALRDRFPAM
jgi:hypothetical protein